MNTSCAAFSPVRKNTPASENSAIAISAARGERSSSRAANHASTRRQRLRLGMASSITRHAGLVPGVHDFLAPENKTWMAGTSPAMTKSGTERGGAVEEELALARILRERRGTLEFRPCLGVAAELFQEIAT